VKLRIRSPAGERQVSHNPAMPIGDWPVRRLSVAEAEASLAALVAQRPTLDANVSRCRPDREDARAEYNRRRRRRNELCAELDNRMPAVLKPDAWPAWLGEQPADVPELKALLAPCPSDEMICWPVSARVGNVKNNDPSLTEPIAGIV